MAPLPQILRVTLQLVNHYGNGNASTVLCELRQCLERAIAELEGESQKQAAD